MSICFGQMSMCIDGHRLKNSYDENKDHHRVRRHLISKYSYISAKWSMVSGIFNFDFDPKMMKMMPRLPIYGHQCGCPLPPLVQ